MAANKRKLAGRVAVALILGFVLIWLASTAGVFRGDVKATGSQPENETAGSTLRGERPLEDGAVAADHADDGMNRSPEVLRQDGAPHVDPVVTRPEVPAYFSNRREYLITNKHWSTVFASDRLGWVDRLNGYFDQPDTGMALDGESDLALRAVLDHPGYSYTPNITLSSLTATCNNMICKVDVAPNHKSELVLDYGGRDPSTGLSPLDEVLFSNNFGHHVSKLDSSTGVVTHYLVVNGFDFE